MHHGLRGVHLTADLLHPWLRSSIPARRDRNAGAGSVTNPVVSSGSGPTLTAFVGQATVRAGRWARAFDLPLAGGSKVDKKRMRQMITDKLREEGKI